jgi:GntR family transcriptional regulator
VIAKTLNIDRTSFEPAYVQLVNILTGQIASGEFRPGERLPPESQLCRHYRVSPMTVRRSINILLQNGLVTTIQGSGTFVKPMELSKVVFGLDELGSIFGRDAQNRVKLLEVNIIKAQADVARKLTIRAGDNVIHIRRLISRDDEPVFYHQEYLVYDPTRPIVEAEMEVTSLHGLFAGSEETTLKRGELTIEAAVLGEAEAHLLGAPPMLPSFRLEHLFYDFDNRPVSWGFFLCRGDRLHFTTTVGLGQGPARPKRGPGDNA